MNLERIGLQLCEQSGEIIEPHSMIGGFNQSKGASRQTAPTAITTAWVNAGTGVNGISRTHSLAGPRTIRWAAGRVKDSFAEMGIATIADADHQPRSMTGAFTGPVETGTSSIDNSSIGCHINTLNTRYRINSTEISYSS